MSIVLKCLTQFCTTSHVCQLSFFRQSRLDDVGVECVTGLCLPWLARRRVPALFRQRRFASNCECDHSRLLLLAGIILTIGQRKQHFSGKPIVPYVGAFDQFYPSSWDLNFHELISIAYLYWVWLTTVIWVKWRSINFKMASWSLSSVRLTFNISTLPTMIGVVVFGYTSHIFLPSLEGSMKVGDLFQP